jgi:hypothetical protein
MTDGIILCVSTIGHSIFFINKLWLPSSMKKISSENHSENESIESIVIDNVSKLDRIEAKTFKKTKLEFMKIPVSVGFLGEECFSDCSLLSSITFECSSRLSRIEAKAFYRTGLIEIIIPASVEFLG